MLTSEKGDKPFEIDISEEIWTNIRELILQGIEKKINAAKKLLEIDKEIAAGIYIYAVEEFGKYLLLERSKPQNGLHKIPYRNQFTYHNVKFTLALDYFEEHGFEKCKVLNNEGSFSTKSYSWRSFTQGLLAKTEARLSIFYTDFIYSSTERDVIEIMKTPSVDAITLSDAINELESAIKQVT
jgi:hypothetical protein